MSGGAAGRGGRPAAGSAPSPRLPSSRRPDTPGAAQRRGREPGARATLGPFPRAPRPGGAASPGQRPCAGAACRLSVAPRASSAPGGPSAGTVGRACRLQASSCQRGFRSGPELRSPALCGTAQKKTKEGTLPPLQEAGQHACWPAHAQSAPGASVRLKGRAPCGPRARGPCTENPSRKSAQRPGPVPRTPRSWSGRPEALAGREALRLRAPPPCRSQTLGRGRVPGKVSISHPCSEPEPLLPRLVRGIRAGWSPGTGHAPLPVRKARSPRKTGKAGDGEGSKGAVL